MDILRSRLIRIMFGLLLFIAVQTVRRFWGSAQEDRNGTENVTQADADLYLQVLRATAQRVQHPTSEDLATIDALSRIKNVRTASASELTSAEKGTIQRAILLTSALDEIVAREMNVEMAPYLHAKGSVQAVLPPPDEDQPQVSAELSAAEKQALKSKGKALAPHAPEIKELYAVINDNPLRQTVKGH